MSGDRCVAMLSGDTLVALQSFVTADENRVFETMLKRVPGFMAKHDCGHFFPIEDRHDFALRWRALHRWRMVADYNALRQEQLVAAGFRFWVYKTGLGQSCPEHAAWDGFCAPSDHPIWSTHIPANSWGCSCRIVGADAARRIALVGGDPDRSLPEGWNNPMASTGLPPGIESGFGTGIFPDMQSCLEALIQGNHRRFA